jgi:4-hydroxy-tetrahydrodipicolinate synthase
MPLVLKGVMQSPVTPLKADFSPDLATFERLLDFHVRTGATAISWPHHKGESLNLTIPERKAFAEVAVKVVAKRIPVSIHVSALSLEDSLDLARHAQAIGADAIIAITPYFWNPSQEAIYDYFVKLGTTIDLPLIAYNSPAYLEGVAFTGELTKRLIERLPNFIGMKEASFNSETYLEIARAALSVRPDFAMISGVEFLAPAIPMGGAGSYSSAGAICPNLCTQLYAACAAGASAQARALQFKLAALWDLFRDQYPSSLKGGMVLMGRPVGPTRPPLPTASEARVAHIGRQLEALGIMESEPHGW